MTDHDLQILRKVLAAPDITIAVPAFFLITAMLCATDCADLDAGPECGPLLRECAAAFVERAKAALPSEWVTWGEGQGI